ncbi:MAG: ComE operon protein 2 [Apilactobacillus sp.]|uniref:ComE operon protein 2 n=1 Tax=Apilactobacillus apinorum TaxID=1218495 RepID=A0ABP9ZGV2_9LACO|nr:MULTISPECIES: ComE operon protein 2 [Apilactobacillus]KOY69034.1 ComE operon protein 2 [Apilactobacillus apinorum]MCT6822881.1 ComE operon protein 2 [Apilactobacillus sp.]MCT6858900.1 ComE operon protein 2 [Apilactobacillus sp.]CAI2680743.1 ComE operon protein [Apilactobacillus apinorum]
MTKHRIPWDQYFMLQAVLLSTRGTCNRLSVGATIVRDKRIIAGGYNGSVAGDEHCIDVGCYMRDGHCLRTIHAEMNAISQCAKFGESTDGAEIYVTDFPCLPCTKVLLQAGITKINYLRNYHNDEYAVSLIKQNNVELNQVTLDEETIKQIEFGSYLPK